MGTATMESAAHKGGRNASINYRKGALLCLSLILALSILIPQLRAASSVTITFSSNPVNYGQNDKITAATSPVYPKLTLYINSNIVASASKPSVNYTICHDGPCLIPGAYAITAYNNLTGASTTDNLVVNPTYPRVSVQYSKLSYGNSDKITAYPAFYNDSISIYVDGASVATGTGSITYTVCAPAPNSTACPTLGIHNVSVQDTTEGGLVRVKCHDQCDLLIRPDA